MLHTLRFSLQNAVYFIMLPFFFFFLFTFYIQGVLKSKCKTPVPKGSWSSICQRVWEHQEKVCLNGWSLDWDLNVGPNYKPWTLDCNVQCGTRMHSEWQENSLDITCIDDVDFKARQTDRQTVNVLSSLLERCDYQNMVFHLTEFSVRKYFCEWAKKQGTRQKLQNIFLAT
jgi:hypothetical protein